MPCYRHDTEYSYHFACVPCRIVIKGGLEKSSTNERRGHRPVAARTCPHCNAPMKNVGRTFKAPRKGDNAQWKKVELLLKEGARFSDCCGTADQLPKTTAALKAALRRAKRANAFITSQDIHKKTYRGTRPLTASTSMLGWRDNGF